VKICSESVPTGLKKGIAPPDQAGKHLSPHQVSFSILFIYYSFRFSLYCNCCFLCFSFCEDEHFLTPRPMRSFHSLLRTWSSWTRETITVSTLAIFPFLFNSNLVESRIGHFAGALLPNVRKFSYFFDYLNERKESLKDKKVFMYCTGGIRYGNPLLLL
jgi:hypothetical protein